MFIKATLVDGSAVVSEFKKLAKFGRYARSVLSGGRPLNVWRVIGDTHPTSGEAITVRNRELIAGSQIARLEQVEPTTERHDYAPENFQSVKQTGGASRYGSWTKSSRDTALADIPNGTQFPVRRTDDTLSRYIVLAVANGGAEEKRYWIDAPNGASGPADAEDDLDVIDDSDDDSGL